jgi:tetratricopeptide (TPR) repeat protein
MIAACNRMTRRMVLRGCLCLFFLVDPAIPTHAKEMVKTIQRTSSLASLPIEKPVFGFKRDDVPSAFQRESPDKILSRVASTFHRGRQLAGTGDMEQALPFFRTALSEAEPLLGPYHSIVADIVLQLARASRILDNLNEGKVFYIRALQIKETVHGKRHPEVSRIRLELADVLEQHEDYQASETLIQEELDLAHEISGPTHQRVADLLVRLAALQKAQGKRERIESLLERALQIREGEPAATREASRVPILLELADLRRSQGDDGQAVRLYEQALAIQQEKFGTHHPMLSQTLMDVASSYERLGKKQEAREKYLAARDHYLQAGGEPHPNLAVLYTRLGQLAQQEGQRERAEHFAQQSIDLLARDQQGGKSNYGEI